LSDGITNLDATFYANCTKCHGRIAQKPSGYHNYSTTELANQEKTHKRVFFGTFAYNQSLIFMQKDIARLDFFKESNIANLNLYIHYT
jgi:hypothetical protein